jgi:ribonucleoside-diphosphate reductase alpha chain
MALDLAQAATHAKDENARVASAIGINPAHRVTTVKPAGTTSLVLGTSSGVHAWHNDYYIRRMRVTKEEPVYEYLQQHHGELVADDAYDGERTAVLSFPQRAPPGAILRSEPALSLLDRVAKLHQHWIVPGHRQGANTNNVSTTVSVQPHEWAEVGSWMWQHRNAYNGLCVLPFSDHTYQQAPFEDCSLEEYNTLSQHAYQLDLTQVKEERDVTAFQLAPACAGQQCDVM